MTPSSPPNVTEGYQSAYLLFVEVLGTLLKLFILGLHGFAQFLKDLSGDNRVRDVLWHCRCLVWKGSSTKWSFNSCDDGKIKKEEISSSSSCILPSIKFWNFPYPQCNTIPSPAQDTVLLGWVALLCNSAPVQLFLVQTCCRQPRLKLTWGSLSDHSLVWSLRILYTNVLTYESYWSNCTLTISIFS